MAGRAVRIATAAVAAAAITIGSGIAAALASVPRDWHIEATIGKRSGQTSMVAVVATSSSDAWSIGSTGSKSLLLIERWNGTRWAKVADPAELALGYQEFGATSASNAWLQAGLHAYHWTGGHWRRLSIPAWAVRGNHSGLPNETLAFFGNKDVWDFSLDAVSQPDIAARYNGHKWIKERLPAEPAVVGWLSGTDIWAFGEDTATRRVVAMHYNGHSWTTRNVPMPKQPVGALPSFGQGTGVAVIGSDNAWFQQLSKIWHFDAGHWSSASLSKQGLSIVGIVQDGHGGLWVPAYGSGPAPVEYLSHLSNGRWTRYRIPSAGGHQAEVADLAWVPGTRSVWAAGALPTGSDTSITSEGIFLRYQP